MGRKAGGTFNGTGAAVYLCVGFIPDWVAITSLEGADSASVYWSRRMRAADCIDGILDTGGNSYRNKLTTGTGIQPYFGGDLMTSTIQTTTTYGEGVYLARDDKDYRVTAANGGDAAGAIVNYWNRGVAAGKGYFTQQVTGTYIGEGSKIVICNGGDQRGEYVITALSSNGEQASEVTLDLSVPSGDITYIGGMYDYAPVSLGRIAPAGFVCNLTALINVNNDIQFFECGTYDDGK